MKKTIVSVVIIGIFVLYCFLHAGSNPVAVVPNTQGTSRPTAGATPTPPPAAAAGTTSTPGVTPTPGSLYTNGSYTGSVADGQWGVVQVKVTIAQGKITNVQFLQYPNDRSRSVYINMRRAIKEEECHL